jgi:hypothetical protein
LPGLQIVDTLRGRSLGLTELGCSGETTTTMIHGGICAYPDAPSQVAAATRFLAAHRGHMPLVTLAIGANDVDVCARFTGIDLNCVQQGLATIMTNLTTIVTALKQADPGVGTEWVGLNEYDPFLAADLQGTTGQQFAQQSLQLLAQLNQILAADYGPAGFRVGDVARAFRTTESNPVPPPGVGQVPRSQHLPAHLHVRWLRPGPTFIQTLTGIGGWQEPSRPRSDTPALSLDAAHLAQRELVSVALYWVVSVRSHDMTASRRGAPECRTGRPSR